MSTAAAWLGRVLRGYATALNRYADFSGRSNWSEYLSFLAVNVAITLIFRLLEAILQDGFFSLIALLYGLAVLIPGLAVTVRLLRTLFGERESL